MRLSIPAGGTIEVSLTKSGAMKILFLSVHDDGVGFAVNGHSLPGHCHGLIGMRERAPVKSTPD